MRKRSTTGPSKRSQDGEAQGGRILPCPIKSLLPQIKLPTNTKLKDSNRTRATSTPRSFHKKLRRSCLSLDKQGGMEKFPHGCGKASGDGPEWKNIPLRDHPTRNFRSIKKISSILFLLQLNSKLASFGTNQRNKNHRVHTFPNN